jgi:hypothetical protein
MIDLRHVYDNITECAVTISITIDWILLIYI